MRSTIIRFTTVFIILCANVLVVKACTPPSSQSLINGGIGVTCGPIIGCAAGERCVQDTCGPTGLGTCTYKCVPSRECINNVAIQTAQDLYKSTNCSGEGVRCLDGLDKNKCETSWRTVYNVGGCNVCCVKEEIMKKAEEDLEIKLKPQLGFFTLMYSGKRISDIMLVITPVVKILYYGGLFIGMCFIVLSGYNLMTSEGNPQKTQEGQEQLTAAILGIAFLLLSSAILRVIISVISS